LHDALPISDRFPRAQVDAGEDPFVVAAGATASDFEGPVVAGAADVAVRPAGCEASEPTAADAGLLVPTLELLDGAVGRAHSSVRTRAGRGRSLATTGACPVVSVVPVRRTPAFSAVVTTRSAGVQARMSQSAESTCNDSRSGVPETRR